MKHVLSLRRCKNYRLLHRLYSVPLSVVSCCTEHQQASGVHDIRCYSLYTAFYEVRSIHIHVAFPHAARSAAAYICCCPVGVKASAASARAPASLISLLGCYVNDLMPHGYRGYVERVLPALHNVAAIRYSRAKKCVP